MIAYATLLSSNNYLPGVLTLHYSLKRTDTKIPFLVMVTAAVSKQSRERLESAGCEIMVAPQSFPVPDHVMADIPVDRWRLCFDKLRFFGLTKYQCLVYLDADMLVMRNIDHLFEYPHLSAATSYGGLKGFEQWSFPNAGFWVIRPEAGLDEKIWSVWPKVYAETGNVNDQTLIYEYLRKKWEGPDDWLLPSTYNCFVYLIDRFVQEKNFNINFETPDENTIAILHFVTRYRPWLMSSLEIFAYLLRRGLKRKWTEISVFRTYRKWLRQI